MAYLRLVLIVLVSLDLRQPPMHAHERRRVTIYAVGAVTLLLIGCWQWNPENNFQALDELRQYFLLIVAMSVTTSVIFQRTNRHTVLWIFWLWTAFLTSTKAKHGLAWTVVPWEGGYWFWLVIGNAVLLAQLLLVVMWWRMLEHVPLVATALGRVRRRWVS